jgi:hypothetical protein
MLKNNIDICIICTCIISAIVIYQFSCYRHIWRSSYRESPAQGRSLRYCLHQYQSFDPGSSAFFTSSTTRSAVPLNIYY